MDKLAHLFCIEYAPLETVEIFSLQERFSIRVGFISFFSKNLEKISFSVL
jgi:hypothetical protein